MTTANFETNEATNQPTVTESVEAQQVISVRSPEQVLRRISQVVSNHGLMLFAILLIALYSFLLPNTFPSVQTAHAVLGACIIVSLLAQAETIVVAAGNFDLSVAYNIGLLHIVAMGMLVWMGFPWPLVICLTIALGATIGFINGLLVEYAKIDSFIATIGVGTILYGLGAWYTNGAQIVGDIPNQFSAINDGSFFGVPIPAILIGLLTFCLWISFEYLPIGRHIYAIGGNRKAAELIGIPARQIVVGTFVASGTIVGIAAVVLAARLQVGQSAVGPEFLLPSFVGAMLGSTTIHPGRVNALGTLVAVVVLSIGIAGLQQLGGGFFVEPIFQGSALVLSVGIAGYAQRRRRNRRL
jgi:ribose transport system permease protein